MQDEGRSQARAWTQQENPPDRRSPLAQRINGGNSKDLHPIKIRHEVIWNNQLIALLVSCSLADPKKFKFLRGMPSLGVFFLCFRVFFQCTLKQSLVESIRLIRSHVWVCLEKCGFEARDIRTRDRPTFAEPPHSSYD